MKLEEISEIYSMISSAVDSVSARKQAISLRKQAFGQASGLVKIAFDTRRVDQEQEYISRRGLQNYSRSEAFITEATTNRLNALAKLKHVLETIQDKYGREHEWQDSYCRVLLDTINKSLRTDQKDGDFTDTQPGVGNFAYIEEMLFVRYRIELANVISMDDETLEKIILGKDQELVNKDVKNYVASRRDGGNHKYDAFLEKLSKDVSYLTAINKRDVGKENYDTLLEKLFSGAKATKENPEIERTITITIKDSIKDQKENKETE